MSATEVEPEVEQGGYECPECGERFRLAMQLGLHRRRAHGVEGSSGKGKSKSGTTRTRQPKQSAHTRRRQQIRETLLEVVSFRDEMRGIATEEPVELADVIRRDADKIAEMVACWADQLNPLGAVVDRLMHGTVIATIRGMSGLAKWFVRTMREERQPDMPEFGEEVASGDGEPGADFGYPAGVLGGGS